MTEPEKIEDFKLRLSNALLDKLDFETASIFDEVHFDDDAFRWDLLIEYALINPDDLLEAGLSEIDFTPENLSLGVPKDTFFGFHTLESGFTYLGLYSKPEFESPVAFALALNEDLNPFVYVPKQGNNFDTTSDSSFEWSDEDDGVFDQKALIEDLEASL